MPETPVTLLDRARRFLVLTRSRAGGRNLHDPADMGTAFGLDAITVLEPESPEELALRQGMAPPSRFEHRLHRRSTF